MQISEIVLKARRILGDVDKHRWSDARMLDIVNDGLKDINVFAGIYRSEHYFELMNYQSRYPLPTNLLTVTSAWHNKTRLSSESREFLSDKMFIIKDQLDVDVLEVVNPPAYQFRSKRFVAGPDFSLGDSTTTSLWSNGGWTANGAWTSTTAWGVDSGQVIDLPIDPLTGVAVNPVVDEFGVTEDLSISTDIYADTVNTPFGLLTSIVPKSLEALPIRTQGDVYGVLTSVHVSSLASVDSGGSIGFVNKPFRVVGRYGTVTSVLRPEEYVRILYKALPPPMSTLGMVFPLATRWETPMVYWIVGTALQDDNDAGNQQRALSFISRYTRDLEDGVSQASKDFGSVTKAYTTKYIGGIQ